MDRTRCSDSLPSATWRECAHLIDRELPDLAGFWFNWKNGVNKVAVQTPQYDISSLDESGHPAHGPVRQPGILANVATNTRSQQSRQSPTTTSAGDRPVCQRRKTRSGRVANQVDKSSKEPGHAAARQPPDHARPGADHAQCVFRPGRGAGLAIVLVYLLIVVNFQSWVDPLIIITRCRGARGHRADAVPDGHDLSVPALTGAIMTMGVATANSILMVSFARQRLSAGDAAPPRSKPASPGSGRC